MGRPPKPLDERTTEQLNVRFTGKTRARLNRLAVHLRERSAGSVIKRAIDELYERVFGRDAD